MKKTIAAVGAFVLSLSLAACGEADDSSANGTSSPPTATSPETTDSATPSSGTDSSETAGEPFANLDGASWDAATSTLTLTDSAIAEPISFENDATIVVKGNSSISFQSNSPNEISGILAKGNLTITGDGSLKIETVSAGGPMIAIRAKDVVVNMDPKGKLTLKPSASLDSARAIVSETNVDLKSGTLDLSTAFAEGFASGIGVEALAGDISVSKDADLSSELISAGYSSNSIGLSAAKGKVTIAGIVNLKSEGNGPQIGIQAASGITIETNSKTDVNLASRASFALGLYTTEGDVTSSGDMTVTLNVYTTGAGIWSEGKVVTEGGKLSATIGNDSVSPLLVRKDPREPAAVYGINARKGMSVTGTQQFVSTSSSRTLISYGVVSEGKVTLTDTDAVMTALSPDPNGNGLISTLETTETGAGAAIVITNSKVHSEGGGPAMVSYGGITLNGVKAPTGMVAKTVNGETSFYSPAGEQVGSVTIDVG